MENPIYDRLSRIISYALHPFIIPTLGVALVLFGPTVMGNIALQAKWFLLVVVVLNTMVLPALSVGLFKIFRVIPDLSLQQQRQRMLPVGIMALCYMLCIMMLQRIPMAFLIERFMIAALGCSILVFIVNLYWKISLHMTALGGLIGMLLVLDGTGLARLQGALLAFILLGGLLASARLQLGSHNPLQVAAGLLCGTTIAAATLLFL